MSAQGERIIVTRRIRATPEHVFRFFTDPALWARWQGTSATVDAQAGGALRVVMGPDGSGLAEGQFVELDPFERIVFTWGWASSPLSTLPPGSTVVTVHLHPDGDGTILTLTHDLLPLDERAIHEAGWSLYLDRLVTVAQGGDPGPDPRFRAFRSRPAYDRDMTRFPNGFDVQGPVQAEVFVVWLAGDHLELTGPCGAAPWLIELGADDHPVEVVTRLVGYAIGDPLLVHSTSWRRDRGAVILSFVVVIDRGLVGAMASVPIERSALARGEAKAAPQAIPTAQVVEHGLRHMAWLAVDDPVVAAELPDGWHALLATYVQEPFRNLG